jgi:hypothetical protein
MRQQKQLPPPLPTHLWSPLGPVPVELVEHLHPLSKDAPPDVDDFGAFDPKRRVIQVLADLEPWAQWQALRHEWVHMVIYDAGLHNAYGGDQIEAFCDVIGTAMAAEMRNQ